MSVARYEINKSRVRDEEVVNIATKIARAAITPLIKFLSQVRFKDTPSEGTLPFNKQRSKI